MTILEGVKNNGMQLSAIKETWYRLGRIDLASRPLIITLLVAHLLTVFGFELGRVGERPFLTLAVAFTAEVIFWGTYLTLYTLQVWLLGPRSNVLVKVFIIVFSNTVRTMSLEVALFQFDLVDQIRISERFLGDSTGILILLIGIAYIQVVLVDLGAQELDLKQVKAKLNEEARASKISAENADKSLRSRAKEILGEQLRAITKYLKSAKSPDSERLTNEIQNLIDSKVRPLSAELWRRLDRIEEPMPTPLKLSRSRFPRSVVPALDFRPHVVFPLAGLNIFITAPGLANWPQALGLGLWMLTFPVLGLILTALYPKRLSSGVWSGALIIGLLSVLAWLPSLFYLGMRSADYPGLAVLGFTSTMVIILTSLGVGIWSAFKRERLAYLEEIEALNNQRARQLALVDQAVWVARRNWSFLVHGTVQGALSVALSRIQLTSPVTPELASEVLKDVERARSALDKTQVFDQPWSEVWPQIEQTWDSVCKVRHEASEEAEKVLALNTATSTCVSEIAKELVSNAFRHGKASEVNIEISLRAGDDLLITSTNNGLPIDENVLAGIGSEMFGELTSSWSWTNTEEGPLFLAVVPIATSPEVSPASS